MSSVANPQFDLVLFTPQDGHDSHHGTPHPMISMGSYAPPFTLLKNTGIDVYEMRYTLRVAENARVYVIGFTTSTASPTFRWSGGANTGAQAVFISRPEALAGATQLWMGAWWDDGSFPNTPAGIDNYFREHPDGSEHHTVPVLIG